MKTLLTALLLFGGFFANDALAQARKLTERVVNPDKTLRQPTQPVAPAQNRQSIAPPPQQQQQPLPAQNPLPEKTKEQKEELVRKTIEFQKKRAEAGAPTAQYDLGMRYLNGDGVEKDLDLAKKWLSAAATNGNSQAAKKLETLSEK